MAGHELGHASLIWTAEQEVKEARFTGSYGVEPETWPEGDDCAAVAVAGQVVERDVFGIADASLLRIDSEILRNSGGDKQTAYGRAEKVIETQAAWLKPLASDIAKRYKKALADKSPMAGDELAALVEPEWQGDKPVALLRQAERYRRKHS